MISRVEFTIEGLTTFKHYADILRPSHVSFVTIPQVGLACPLPLASARAKANGSGGLFFLGEEGAGRVRKNNMTFDILNRLSRRTILIKELSIPIAC
jgi:hypothetical protein